MPIDYVELVGLLLAMVGQLCGTVWVASNGLTRLKVVETQIADSKDIDSRLTKLEVIMDNVNATLKEIRDTLRMKQLTNTQ